MKFNEKLSGMEEAILTTFEMTDEELAAMENQKKMTQEIFDQLCKKFCDHKAYRQLDALIERYPEYVNK